MTKSRSENIDLAEQEKGNLEELRLQTALNTEDIQNLIANFGSLIAAIGLQEHHVISDAADLSKADQDNLLIYGGNVGGLKMRGDLLKRIAALELCNSVLIAILIERCDVSPSELKTQYLNSVSQVLGKDQDAFSFSVPTVADVQAWAHDLIGRVARRYQPKPKPEKRNLRVIEGGAEN